jgi:hypothetical protein
VDPPDSLGVGEPGELIAFDADGGAVLFRTKLHAGRGAGFSFAHGRVFVGSGFPFFGWSDEPLDGALEVFGVPWFGHGRGHGHGHGDVVAANRCGAPCSGRTGSPPSPASP